MGVTPQKRSRVHRSWPAPTHKSGETASASDSRHKTTTMKHKAPSASVLPVWKAMESLVLTNTQGGAPTHPSRPATPALDGRHPQRPAGGG